MELQSTVGKIRSETERRWGPEASIFRWEKVGTMERKNVFQQWLFRFKFVGLAVLGFWLVWFGLLWSKPSNAADVRLLFVGNSYTYGNNLNDIMKQLMERGVASFQDVYTQRYAPGGYRFPQHYKDASDPNSTAQLRQFLVTGQDPLYKWDFVIFQDQSQVPGFPQNNSYWLDSRNGLKGLHQLVQQKGGQSVLLMTWGRRKGDSQNAQMFPNFKAMQSRLRSGYKAYAAQAGTSQAPIYIAPAGLAWERVYDDIAAQQQDPTADNTRFSVLYEGDGSHPSVQGSFLAACVLYTTLTGRDPSTIAWSPGNIPNAERSYYQSVAFDTVMKGVFGEFQYPWALDWADYTWPQNTAPTGKAISGVGMMPLVRVQKDVGSVPELWLGVTHDGNKVGDGRLWITAGGKLVVQTLLHVGFEGTGQVEHRDGAVETKKILFGKGANSNYKLLGGTLQTETIEGNGVFSMTGGTLVLQNAKSTFVQAGGTLSPGPGVARTFFEQDYTLEAKGTIAIEVADPTKAEGKGADLVQANATMSIAGTIKVAFGSGVQLSQGQTVVLLRAKTLDLKDGWKLDAPTGVLWRKRDDFGTQVLEIYSEQAGTPETMAEPTAEPTVGPEPSGDDAATQPEPNGAEPTIPEPSSGTEPSTTTESGSDSASNTEGPANPGQGCCQIQSTPRNFWLILLLALGFLLWRKQRLFS